MKKKNDLVGVLGIILFFVLIVLIGNTSPKIEKHMDYPINNTSPKTEKHVDYSIDKMIENRDDKQLLYLSGDYIVYEDKAKDFVLSFGLFDGDDIYTYDEEFDSIKMFVVDDEVKGIIANYDMVECVADMCIENKEGEYIDKYYNHTGYLNLEDHKNYYSEDKYSLIYSEKEKLYGLSYQEKLPIDDKGFVDRVTLYELIGNDRKEISTYDGEHYDKVSTPKGDYYLRSHWGGTDSPSYDIVYNNKGEELYDGINDMTFVISKSGDLYYIKDNSLYLLPYGGSEEIISSFDTVGDIVTSLNNGKIYVSAFKDDKLIVYDVSYKKEYIIRKNMEEGYRFTITPEPYRIDSPYDMSIHVSFDEKDYCKEYFFTERNNQVQEYKSDCWGKTYEEN